MNPSNDYSQYRRQSFRLQGYDYRNEGMYFVTICTKDRFSYFGEVKDGQMILSEIGQIVSDNWFKIPQFSPHIVLDEFVVMPNHIHGILAIVSSVALLHCNDATGCNDATDTDDKIKNHFMASISPKSGSISRVLNSYKGACTKQITLSVISLHCNDVIEHNDNTTSTSVTSLQCNDAKSNAAAKHRDDAMAFGWQSKFHDRIIRNEEELRKIQNYITKNPANWHEDENFIL